MASQEQSERVEKAMSTFTNAFGIVSNFWDTPHMIPVEAVTVWMKKAGILHDDAQEKEVQEAINEVKKNAKDPNHLDANELQETMAILAKKKNLDKKDMVRKMTDSLGPELSKGLDKGVEVAKGVLRNAGIVSKDTGVSEADLDEAVNKYLETKDNKSINVNELQNLVEVLAKEKGLDKKDLFSKVETFLGPFFQGSLQKSVGHAVDTVKGIFGLKK